MNFALAAAAAAAADNSDEDILDTESVQGN